MSPAANSQRRTAWRQFRKNPSALVGLCLILAALLFAILAYWLAPDYSPHANRMIIELNGKPPGHRQWFLAIQKEEPAEKANAWRRTLDGERDGWTYTPITAWQQQGDSLRFDQYLDEQVTERKSIRYDASRYRIVEVRYWLGTDKYGRDILSRLLIGTRVSLSVGIIAVLISLLIGITLGSVAGYFGGGTDAWVTWFINVVWSIPTLLLVFGITLALGKGFWQVFIAVGLTLWVNVARTIRGQVLSIREMEYIEAARALGYSHMRIIIRHILPNVMGPVMVLAASNFASAIVMEAGLSFLGVGVQSPQASWGLMIKENYNFIITSRPMLALVPGFAIMLLVLAFHLVGSGLRDALDVRGH
ncbi:MAG: ABC transporter permease [Bacteroidetes bacterium]|nr:ABC transporter permease [Bacteroidota bacterium]